LHLLGSSTALVLVLGGLYLGWYRWPGWYLANVAVVVATMAGVDVVLGPLLTLLIANPRKPRGELARDIGVIILVQFAALAYATMTLWHGRPIIYAYSQDRIELVRASDIPASELALGIERNPDLTPRWYSTPRWVSAQLPDDPAVANEIMQSALQGGADVIAMPRYYRPWDTGVASLRKHLGTVDPLTTLGRADKQRLKKRLSDAGFAPDNAATILVTGRGDPLIAVVDAATGQVVAIP
jgi:hypothetical protein